MSDTPIAENRVVAFVDTETLGLDPDHHPVWEIGLILPNGDECCWQVAVTPRELSLAHPIALDIGGFNDRYDEQAAVGPAVAAHRLATLIPKGTHLAGAVVSFDEERLRRLMWRWVFAPPWHYHMIDVETLATGYLAGVEFGKPLDFPWNSETLSRAVGVNPDDFDRHTALGDARWAKAIYEAVMA